MFLLLLQFLHKLTQCETELKLGQGGKGSAESQLNMQDCTGISGRRGALTAN